MKRFGLGLSPYEWVLDTQPTAVAMLDVSAFMYTEKHMCSCWTHVPDGYVLTLNPEIIWSHCTLRLVVS